MHRFYRTVADKPVPRLYSLVCVHLITTATRNPFVFYWFVFFWNHFSLLWQCWWTVKLLCTLFKQLIGVWVPRYTKVLWCAKGFQGHLVVLKIITVIRGIVCVPWNKWVLVNCWLVMFGCLWMDWWMDGWVDGWMMDD